MARSCLPAPDARRVTTPALFGGHLASVVQMLEEGKPCLTVVQQLQAVEKAITQAKKTLIHDHLGHCLEDVVGPVEAQQQASLDEFRQITKYL